jgi:hypothetical protein
MQNILIKLLESNVASLSCQISSLLQEKNELEEQETRIGFLEKENQNLKHCQEETPTKGDFDLYFVSVVAKYNIGKNKLSNSLIDPKCTFQKNEKLTLVFKQKRLKLCQI